MWTEELRFHVAERKQQTNLARLMTSQALCFLHLSCWIDFLPQLKSSSSNQQTVLYAVPSLVKNPKCASRATSCRIDLVHSFTPSLLLCCAISWLPKSAFPRHEAVCHLYSNQVLHFSKMKPVLDPSVRCFSYLNILTLTTMSPQLFWFQSLHTEQFCFSVLLGFLCHIFSTTYVPLWPSLPDYLWDTVSIESSETATNRTEQSQDIRAGDNRSIIFFFPHENILKQSVWKLAHLWNATWAAAEQTSGVLTV